MARNRKRQNGGVRVGPVIRALLLCLFIGLIGVGYVWQKNQIYALGQAMHQHEKHLDQLRRENENRQRTLAHFRSSKYLESRVKALRLGLEMPNPEQIITLPEVPQAPAAAPDPVRRQMVAQAGPDAAPRADPNRRNEP